MILAVMTCCSRALRHCFGAGSDLRPDPMNGQPEEKAYEIRDEDRPKTELRIDATSDQGRNQQQCAVDDR